MAHKRQRTDNGAADGVQQHREDEFLITFGCYGSITLSKGALQTYPSSLITVALLEDGVDEHSLYLPLSHGLETFPRLIQETYACGAPLTIPQLGLPFDLFVKWLRYLGLHSIGRELSTESAAAKRVSYFVETLLNTISDVADLTGYKAMTMECVSMSPDVERHRHDVLPFELARRGIHVSLESQPFRLLTGRDLNLAQLVISYLPEGFTLKTRAPKTKTGTVTGVYPFGPSPDGCLEFEHLGTHYEFDYTFGENGRHTVRQLGATNSYDCRSQLESILVVKNRGIDLVEEFKQGGMVFSCERYGPTLVNYFHEEDDEVYTPFLHGISHDMWCTDESDLENAYLLIIATDAHPLLRFDVENATADIFGSPLRITLTESPDWALETDGEPPVVSIQTYIHT